LKQSSKTEIESPTGSAGGDATGLLPTTTNYKAHGLWE
jgi:hypothetical protein